MKNLTSYTDINALLNKVENSLLILEAKYNESLHNQVVSPELLVEVKDILGNLRSSLDFLSHKFSKNNFPICDGVSDFENRSKDFSASIQLILEKWQPFKGNEWLGQFNILNNKSKHITLIPQKRTEVIETRVTHPQGGSVSWGQGVTFGSGVSVMGVPIDPRTQLPVANNMVKTERIVWVNFAFDIEGIAELPNNILVLPFLKICFEKIVQIINEVSAADNE